jgi:hypothetical protein
LWGRTPAGEWVVFDTLRSDWTAAAASLFIVTSTVVWIPRVIFEKILFLSTGIGSARGGLRGDNFSIAT